MATAQEIIDSARLSELKNISIPEDSDVLDYLNQGVRDIAERLKLYRGSVTRLMNVNLSNYDLPKNLTSIEEVVDSDGRMRPINKPNDQLAVHLTSPFTLQVTLPEANKTITIVHYYAPDDYALTDIVEIPNGLRNALLLYIGYKGRESISSASTAKDSDNTYFQRYESAIRKYSGSGDNTYDENAENTENLNRKGFV